MGAICKPHVTRKMSGYRLPPLSSSALPPSQRSFHGLRHLYASLRIANGDALVDVSRALGHADVTTTDRIYSHAIAERTRVEREAASVASTFAGVLS
jgi:integrase